MVEKELEKMNLIEIKKIIESSIPNSVAYVLDPNNDGQHLEAIVVSPSFQNLLLIKQHQMVMKPLKQAFAESLHALKLKTFTPSQWEEFQKIHHIKTE